MSLPSCTQLEPVLSYENLRRAGGGGSLDGVWEVEMHPWQNRSA